MITPLHNHSEFSPIDGVSKPSEIAERMLEIGCSCCGLTDHGVVAGHLEFDKEMRKRDLKPIFGCELYHGVRLGEKLGRARDQSHLIALAMTDEGLKNLWRLNDAAAQEPRFLHVGRNSWEDLEKYKEGIVFTSACALSLVCKGIIHDDFSAFDRYLNTFGDNFYVELSTYPADALFFDKDSDEPVSPADLNIALANLAEERGVPVVYGDDGHYAFAWQWKYHDTYVAKATGDSVHTPVEDRKMFHPEGALCIKDEDTVRAALSYLPESVVDEAINNAVEIGERADAHLPEVRRHLPVFVPDASPWVEKGKYKEDEADLLFLDLLEDGMHRRYGEDPPERVIEQTAYEAEVFLDAGLHHYFLVDWDMVRFCEEEEIEVGPGRGSAAGCIAAFELGITDVDPLPYDLYFERFWNPGRAKGFPDIDTDIEQKRRKEVKEYLSRRWGHDRVRSIGTVTRLKPKAVVESFARTFGLTDEEQKGLSALIDQIPDIDILGHEQIGWDEETDPGKLIYVMHPSPGYADNDVGERILDWIEKQPANRQKVLIDFLDLCRVLCNRASNYGVHASGIVISDADLMDIAPCRFAGSKEQRIPVTQFAMDDIEKLMLIKLDLLGLRTLDVLSDWRRQMKEYGIEINWSQLEWEDHPVEMWEMLDNGFSAAVFQLEDGYGKHLAKEFRPRSVEDLSIIVATNRPGPIRSGAPDSFITRRNGGTDDKFDGRKIPLLKKTLEPTLGWYLYQEQVIRYFTDLGYDASDADAVRKILGKKQPEKWDAIYQGSEEWEGRSYIDMTAKAGLDRKTADGIWAMLKEFGKYSFNKAHSVAYGTTGFRCTYAKYWGPSEFYMSAVRNVDQQKKNIRLPEYINEARRLSIKVYGPDIEFSQAQVAVHDGDVYLGFYDVANVSQDAANYLVELRDEGVDISSPEALSAELEQRSKERSKINAQRKKDGMAPLDGKSPKQRLNAAHVTNLYTAGAWERLEGYPTSIPDMQDREREMLNGIILSDNVDEMFAAHAEEIEALEPLDAYDEALAPYCGEDLRWTLPGVVTHVRETKVRATQKKMGIVTIYYEGRELTFAVFPDQWRSSRFLWRERTPGVFTIKHSLNKKSGKPGYHFDQGWKFT